MTIKNLILSISCLLIFSATVISCKKDSSNTTSAPKLVGSSYTEEFDTVTSAYDRGWRFLNRSTPVGASEWVTADTTLFTTTSAYSNSSSNPGFIMCDNTTLCFGKIPDGVGSNWLVSPSTVMKNGDSIVFYAMSADNTFEDRLQLRINPSDDSLSVGLGTDVGRFTNLLLDINPMYDQSINPFQNTWTRYSAKIYGLSKPIVGRFAFRSFLQYNGGLYYMAGSAIGIDQVSYISVP